MEIQPIKSETDYQAALPEIEELMDAEPGTQAGDRLDVLATLVDAYAAKHHRIDAPDPIEAVRHALEAKGLDETDLQEILGARRERVWEIINKRRRLTMPMIRRIHEHLNVPADVLIRDYHLETGRRA